MRRTVLNGVAFLGAVALVIGCDKEKTKIPSKLDQPLPTVAPLAGAGGGTSAHNKDGGAPAKDKDGGAPAKDKDGGAPAKDKDGGAPAKDKDGGAPAKDKDGGAPAKK